MRIRDPIRRRGFTLIELLIVIAIIGVLIAILLPALSAARKQSQSVVCRANLHGIALGAISYATTENDCVIPAYNMRGVTGSVSNPFDGWAAILDRDAYVYGDEQNLAAPYCCPLTGDVAGIQRTQTGNDPKKPLGYMDWPTVVTVSQNYGVTIPPRHFNKIIRVGYWINGDNPVGLPRLFDQGAFFTGSIGYGPDPAGTIMKPNRASQARVPSRLVAFSDGLYSGGQRATRIGQPDLRIGYRHAAGPPRANVAFADGHVDAIAGDKFPRRAGDGISIEQAREENLGNNPTVYADPQRSLTP